MIEGHRGVKTASPSHFLPPPGRNLSERERTGRIAPSRKVGGQGVKGGERTIKTDRSRVRERERRRRKDKFPAVFDRKARRRRKGGARRRHESALLGLWPQREREKARWRPRLYKREMGEG